MLSRSSRPSNAAAAAAAAAADIPGVPHNEGDDVMAIGSPKQAAAKVRRHRSDIRSSWRM